MNNLTIDLNSIVTLLIGSLVLWYLKENTSEKKELKESNQKLREDVLILKTQLEPIKNALYEVPIIKAANDKLKNDLDNYFSEVKKIKGILSGKGIDL